MTNNTNYRESLSEQTLLSTPTFPDSLFGTLPLLFQACTSHFDDERERDIVLLSSLTLISNCYSKVKGQFNHGDLGPNLFTFIVAPPASGKGVINYVQRLGDPIHKELIQKNGRKKIKYEADLRTWQLKIRDPQAEQELPPTAPRLPLFFIPGNISSAAIYSKMAESDGQGLIYETEADTLSGALKQDWGNFSEILRKAYHHEPISMERRTEGQYCYIPEPSLSILLSGTPSQVPKLIHSTEDGLFSRFIFYTYSRPLIWNEATEKQYNFNKHFQELGEEYIKDMKQKVDNANYKFSLTEVQLKSLNTYFKSKIEEIKQWDATNAASSVYRLSTITFRLAMVLSIARHLEDNLTENKIICQNQDFISALTMYPHGQLHIDLDDVDG